ncbi:U32 family peptidase C-terminal domain-containing protein [bacterium]
MKKPELLVAAGNMEKLKYAFAYGADAVYLGGKEFNLRARANNFEIDEIEEAVRYAHNLNKKIYITLNAFSRTNEEKKIKEYLHIFQDFQVDAVIISDPGVVYLAKKEAPNLNLHLSTQANTTNDLACKFWKELGIKRIVLARELSLKEIKEIVHRNRDLEFEIFIHGAMCISYSGRCFLSTYMADRDANRGDCAHPCRWKYAVLEEEKRKGKYMDYEEDEKGAYIFNTNDMRLIQNVPDLFDTGVGSFKIEGRMKSLYYITCVTRAYRRAFDLAMNSEYTKENVKLLQKEMEMLNNRGYTRGFYFGEPEAKDYNYRGGFDKIKHFFLAQILEIREENKVKVLIKNTIRIDDEVEIITPNLYTSNFTKIKNIFDEEEEIYLDEVHCDSEVLLEFDEHVELSEYSIVRHV